MGDVGSRRWRWAVAVAIIAIVAGVWAASRHETPPAEVWVTVPTVTRSKTAGLDHWLLSRPADCALEPGGDATRWDSVCQISDDAVITSIDLYPPPEWTHTVRELFTGPRGYVLEGLIGAYVPTETTAQVGGVTWTKFTLRAAK